MRGSFQKDRLPSPPSYFESVGLKLKGRGAWRQALCPFHDDTKASLQVQYSFGAFCCLACGAKGGDVLAFHRLKTGLGFKEAAIQLGAWRAE